MHNKIRAIIIIFYDFSIIFLNWSQHFSKNKNNYNHNRKINFNRMVLMITSCIINDFLLEFIDFRVRGNMMKCICQDCPKYLSLLVVLFLNILYMIFFWILFENCTKIYSFCFGEKNKNDLFLNIILTYYIDKHGQLSNLSQSVVSFYFYKICCIPINKTN